MTQLITHPMECTPLLGQARFVSAEFMYKPRPTEPRARRVFDFAMASRLDELSRYPDSAVLLICNNQQTVDSLADLPVTYPAVRFIAGITNPEPISAKEVDFYAETPVRLAWHDPAGWQRYRLTDRWTRINYAFEAVRALTTHGYLIMPANDAVWGEGLLEKLVHLSKEYPRNGLPAAASPYTYYQHSAVPGVSTDPLLIDAVNAAFNRDARLRRHLSSNDYQAFWGKTGIIPFQMCGALRDYVETFVWEDDLEIDRAIRVLGYRAVCRWVDDAQLYRQTLPVFDRAGLRAVIDRTLHYSLNVPGAKSILTEPLDVRARLRRLVNWRYAMALALAESVTAECKADIQARLESSGMSWVDWGAYRYVVRVGDPLVQVWKYEGDML